jgi:hypothetical protein
MIEPFSAILAIARVCGPAVRFSRLGKPPECRSNGVADVEACACGAHIPFTPPPQVPSQLIDGIEVAFLDQALCQTNAIDVSCVHCPG